jgi:ParB-like chromosome segregation protein Spo0J
MSEDKLVDELKIIYKKTEDLREYKSNSRTHSDDQVRQIAASINEFGFTNPILINGDEIVAGHGRLAAAKIAGLNNLPTISISHLSTDQIKALVIADNQLALNAGSTCEECAEALSDYIIKLQADNKVLTAKVEILDGIIELSRIYKSHPNLMRELILKELELSTTNRADDNG